MFKIAFAIPRFPSEFSKSIGFTLCGIAEEPISPALIFCLKYHRNISPNALSKSIIIVLILLKSQKKQQNDRVLYLSSWERVV
jgi:hypothetical protein